MHFTTNEWQTNFRKFIQTTFGGTTRGETAPCPCSRCRCMSYRTQSQVQSHLVIRGFDESFIEEGNQANDSDEGNAAAVVNDDETGDSGSVTELVSTLISGAIHEDIIGNINEEPNAKAKAFFNLLTEAKKELYPGCNEAARSNTRDTTFASTIGPPLTHRSHRQMSLPNTSRDRSFLFGWIYALHQSISSFLKGKFL